MSDDNLPPASPTACPFKMGIKICVPLPTLTTFAPIISQLVTLAYENIDKFDPILILIFLTISIISRGKPLHKRLNFSPFLTLRTFFHAAAAAATNGEMDEKEYLVFNW